MPRLYPLLFALSLTPACGPGETDTETDADPTATTAGPTAPTGPTVSTGDPSTDTDSGSDTDPTTTGEPPGEGVDVLFVIDNSGSMGEEQLALARAMRVFVSRLEGAGVDYRIGVTTTDMGNPRCGLDFFAPPALGKLQLSSCRDRLDDFIFEGASETIDQTVACTSSCDQAVHDALVAGGIEATAVPGDDPKPRAWLEEVGGVTNLSAGVLAAVEELAENQDGDPNNDIPAIAAVMGCTQPQGIRGCGFEAPLEASFFAIALAEDKDLDNNPNRGFLSKSRLAVVYVTDEADCSANFDHQEIFTTNMTFWEGSVSTSAVCWNAGTSCEGSPPGPYLTCDATDYDVNGMTLDPNDPQTKADAVLHPLSRYIDLFANFEAGGTRSVRIYGINGVPVDYPNTPITYIDNPDPDEQVLFGIGPGCATADGSAIPPVRLRELAEYFFAPGESNLYSICAADLAPAAGSIADGILAP